MLRKIAAAYGAALGTAALVLALSPATAHAQEAHAPHQVVPFTGTWELTFDSHMGEMTWTLTLDEEDGALVGAVQSSMGAAVAEGVQDGAEIAFTVLIDEPDHQVELHFTGTIEADEASGSVDILGESFGWSAALVEPR